MGQLDCFRLKILRLVRPHFAADGYPEGNNVNIFPGRADGRSAGEVIGRIVEACALYVIDTALPLLPERVLIYPETHPVKGELMCLRELNGLHRIASGKAVIYEVKLASSAKYTGIPGLEQLRKTASILRCSDLYPHIEMRLVYILPADGVILVIPGIPVVPMEDTTTELGVIWLEPTYIEAAAKELYHYLPRNWNQPEGRQGTIELNIGWN